MVWEAFNIIAINLKMNFETILMIFLNIGFMLFFAKDFKLGALLEFLLNGLLFIWFYNQKWAYERPLVLMFAWLIVMALTFYAVNVEVQKGGLI